MYPSALVYVRKWAILFVLSKMGLSVVQDRRRTCKNGPAIWQSRFCPFQDGLYHGRSLAFVKDHFNDRNHQRHKK